MDIFKIFDSLAQAYAKDIDGYKEIIKAVEAMMDQKEIALQDIKLIVRPICDAVSGISTERNWMNDNILKT